MTTAAARPWFSAFGVELEYMIVDAQTLAVRAIADELLRDVAGSYTGEVERGEISWSNELALHVVELKTTEPAADLAPLPQRFLAEIHEINRLLAVRGARLMPSAMHPWMDPHRQMRLWPHEYSPVYEAYNRIFDCRGHGWANLQSAHLNLPFAGEEQFVRLHAAIRLLLPILPALAASSPLADGRLTGLADTRLEVYRDNARRIAAITALVVPESVRSIDEYHRTILQPMYAQIAPLDPEGILQHEWLNSRGAIARFDRSAIEIRVLDVQECPAADVAIAAVAAAVLRDAAQERFAVLERQLAVSTEQLAAILLAVTREGENAAIDDETYLAVWGFRGKRATAAELWRHLIDGQLTPGAERPWWLGPIERIQAQGTLARRIVRALGTEASSAEAGAAAPERMADVYRQLCDCLSEGTMFVPTA